MNCPNCNSDLTRVLDSRPRNGGNSTRRRYLCDKCDNRWSTREVEVDDVDAKYDLVYVRTDDLRALFEMIAILEQRIFKTGGGQ